MVVTQGQKGTISHAGKEFKRGLNHCVIEHYMLSDHIMIPNDFMALPHRKKKDLCLTILSP